MSLIYQKTISATSQQITQNDQKQKHKNLEAEKALTKLLEKVENGNFENAEQVIGFIRSMKGERVDDLP